MAPATKEVECDEEEEPPPRIWLENIPFDLDNNILFVHERQELDGDKQSPINIDVTDSMQIDLPLLRWVNYEQLPKKIKLTNSGETLVISVKWNCERPYVIGGPLRDGKYVFSQMHFHWGGTAIEGSEHSIEDSKMPLELHVLHFKKSYLNQTEALKHEDGVICVVYLFKIQSEHSVSMHPIVSALRDIRMADTDINIEPFILNRLLYPFEYDYYTYWGRVSDAPGTHSLMWLICREVVGISFEQLCLFRQLMDETLRPIVRNWRETNPMADRLLLHVNPAYKHTNSTLAPVPLRLSPSREYLTRQIEHLDHRDDNFRSMRKLRSLERK